jgi:hypothetical protein
LWQEKSRVQDSDLGAPGRQLPDGTSELVFIFRHVEQTSPAIRALPSQGVFLECLEQNSENRRDNLARQRTSRRFLTK